MKGEREDRQRKRLERILVRWERDEIWLRKNFGTFDADSIAPEGDIQRNHSTAVRLAYELLARAPGYLTIHANIAS